MGLLNFLFGEPEPRKRRFTVEIELPETQYEALMNMIKAVKERENKDFDESKFWSKLVTEWLEKNWGPTVKKLANIDKKTIRRRTRK